MAFLKIWRSVPSLCAKLSWNFHPSRSGCSACAANRQYITGLLIYYRDIICFDGLYLKKWRSACSVLGQNIDIPFGPNGAPLGARWWSTIASFDVALPSESEKPSWIDWTIEISPSTRWILLGLFHARMSRCRVSHDATYCARRSLISYRPVVHTCSHFCALIHRRHMPRGTPRAPPQVPQNFDCARSNGSLFALPVDIFGFTSYGAD